MEVIAIASISSAKIHHAIITAPIGRGTSRVGIIIRFGILATVLVVMAWAGL